MKVEIRLKNIEYLLGKFFVLKSTDKKYKAEFVGIEKKDKGYCMVNFKQTDRNEYTKPQYGIPTDEEFILRAVSAFYYGYKKRGRNIELHTEIEEVWK